METGAVRKPTWIEIRLNGPPGGALQPRISIAPAEIVTGVRVTRRHRSQICVPVEGAR
jgi:hypothetical protein